MLTTLFDSRPPRALRLVSDEYEFLDVSHLAFDLCADDPEHDRIAILSASMHGTWEDRCY